MAILLPYASTISSVTNRDERLVAEFLLDALDDSWYIYPGFRMREHQHDFESDILLVSPHYGVAIIEVKGGNIHIDRGHWVGTPTGSDPVRQAVSNSYLVRDLVSKAIGFDLKVAWAIWLPRAKEYKGSLPAGLNRKQLLLGASLESSTFEIDDFFNESAPKFKMRGTELETVINTLCPTVKFTYDEQFEARRVRERLETILRAQIDAVASLEHHKRVLVQGGAGTGKTALAVKWAYSALHEDEPKRVLLTCYNEPLAAKLRDDMALFDPTDDPERVLRVGAFLSLMASMPGMPTFNGEPTDAGYWSQFERHILEHIDDIEIRFDRVIVDECQDFTPEWLNALESLLDSEGDNEFFLMGDGNQVLIQRGFEAPTPDEGWVVVTLPRNVRNVKAIAALAYRVFSGAKAIELPESDGAVVTKTVSQNGELWPQANLAVRELIESGVPKNEVIVIASSSGLRNELREKLGLVAYEGRGVDKIVCETAHRAKGLEYNYVVLVLDSRLEDSELYVAVTRAINKIVIVSWPSGLARVGLKSTSR